MVTLRTAVEEHSSPRRFMSWRDRMKTMLSNDDGHASMHVSDLEVDKESDTSHSVVHSPEPSRETDNVPLLTVVTADGATENTSLKSIVFRFRGAQLKTKLLLYRYAAGTKTWEDVVFDCEEKLQFLSRNSTNDIGYYIEDNGKKMEVSKYLDSFSGVSLPDRLEHISIPKILSVESRQTVASLIDSTSQ